MDRNRSDNNKLSGTDTGFEKETDTNTRHTMKTYELTDKDRDVQHRTMTRQQRVFGVTIIAFC